MARPLRLEYPGALYHVTARGNAREPIFLDLQDSQEYLSVLTLVVERFNWLCHAYCLMTNHYHLMIETPDGNLSAGMRQLNGVYTQRFNRRHGRVGHIFQGRFKAILVDRESYLLELCRYVVLNPVRAGMVKKASAYALSSFRPTVGLDPVPPFLTVDWVLSQFAKTKASAKRRYGEFVEAGIGLPSPWEELKGQTLLGSEGFVEKLKPYLSGRRTLREVPRKQRLVDRPSLKSLFADADQGSKARRNQLIRRAHLQCGYTLSAIAAHLDIHYTTVSKVVNENGEN
jgi:putative transposase